MGVGVAVTSRKPICQVLVAEDNGEIRELLQDLFSDEGYHFRCVENSEGFFAAMEEGVPDIAIIDMVLPGHGTGLALAKHAANKGIGVILVTGHHDHFETVAASGHRFLLKPFSIAALLDMVRDCLDATKRDCQVARRAG